MKFAVLSDIHYVSPEVIVNDPDSAISSSVSVQALKDASSYDDIDTILITGDLTDKGDKKSHLGLLEILKEIKASGKKIYVTTATHDFNHHRAYTRRRGDTKAVFDKKPWELPYFDKDNADFREFLSEESNILPDEEIIPGLEECFSPDELWELYSDFGRNSAFSVEDSSYSYCVDLDEKTRCLMLNDNFRNEEALHDISVTYSPKCLRWIDEMVKKAKEDGKFIFACTHHPLIPPSPAYRIGAGLRDMRSPYSVHVLADIGINLALTGHSHFSDVGFAESEKGNILCDITTPSVRFYPPKYRIVNLDGLNSRISYKCITVSKPEDVEIGDMSLEEYYRNNLYNEYLNKVLSLNKPFNKIVSEIKVKDIYFLFRHSAKLSEAEYATIKETKLFDLLTSAAFNMLSGDGEYTPDTAEYKLLMSIASALDSIIDTQPFFDVKKKVLKGYSVKEVVEPLCFNNYTYDNEAELDFSVKPDRKTETPIFKSSAGDIVMVLLCGIAILLSGATPYITALALPAATILKKIKLKKSEQKPNYIY